MFTKLFSSITTSSIWNEDNSTRIVWITMLAMADKTGYVSASVGGLAHESRVSKEECEKALTVLKNPDIDSRSKEFEGKRIEIVDGGFQLLNHAKYRAMRSHEERKEYMKSYMKEYRESRKQDVNNVSKCKPPLTAVNRSRSRAEAEQKQNTLARGAREIPITIQEDDPFNVNQEIPEGKRLVIKDKMETPLKSFMEAWNQGFLETFGVAYKSGGEKDRLAAKRLVSAGETCGALIEMAKKAWKKTGGFWTKHAVTICGFDGHFIKIRQEIGDLKPKAANDRAPTPEEKEAAYLERKRIESESTKQVQEVDL